MKIVIAPDSFKGCLSSSEVAHAMYDGVREVFPNCDIIRLAISDGGEGMVEALVDTLKGHLSHALVSDPLDRPINASFGIAGDLAIIESASACGLTLLKEKERNPLITTTKGLGKLILAAINQGCRRFLIGLGGSATNDGGMGMIRYSGFLEKAKGLDFTIACDVDTPYIGPNGSSRIFGPQKGASPDDVEILEKRLTDYAKLILEETGVDVSNIPGAGAAGGLGGAFKAYLGANLKLGIDLVLDNIGFDNIINGADLVITGEGCSDYQTLKGKTATGVLEHAHRQGIPVALVSGGIKDEDLLKKGGFSIIERVSPEGMHLEEAMQPEVAKNNIRLAIKNLFKHE